MGVQLARSYTHGTEWADKNPNIPEEQLQAIRDFKNAGLKVITAVILPRPYVLTEVIDLSDAVMVVYRGGNGIMQAVAEVIFGDFSPTGKLPFQLPRSQEQVGTDNPNNQIEKWELPYDIGASATERALIRTAMQNDLPVPLSGDPLFQYGFGLCYGCDTFSPPPSVDTANPISNFNLLLPADGSSSTNTNCVFSWEMPTLPDSIDSELQYAFYIDGSLAGILDETSCAIEQLSTGTHTWYVQALAGQYKRNSSSVFSFTITETNSVEAGKKAELNIYPNPVKDGHIIVESNSFANNNMPIEIYNIMGQKVLSQKRTQKKTLLNISFLPQGTYVVRVGTHYAVMIKTNIP